MKADYSKENLEQIVKDSYSVCEVARKLGLKDKGSTLKTIKKYISIYGIDTSHFTGQNWRKGKTQTYLNKLENILKPNINYGSNRLLKRLVEEGIKPYECEKCHNSTWMGESLTLELHHIDGDHYNNSLENLQILCPNCHAMTDSHVNIQQLSALVEKQEVEGRKFREALISRLEKEKAIGNPEPSLNVEEGAETRHVQPKSRKKQVLEPKYCEYCGKELEGRARQNKYCSQECSHKANGSKRPDVLTLLEDFKELKSFVQVSKKYGVTDNAVRKWCKLYGILDKVKGQSRPQTK